MSCLDKKLFRDLRRLWGQVLAIALVIGAGVATVVLSLSTYQSLQETRLAYYEQYRFGEIFAFAKRAPNLLKDRIQDIPGVALVHTRIVEQLIFDVETMDEPIRGQIISIPENHEPTLNHLVLLTGRWIRYNQPDEILINDSFATAHGFNPGDTISGNINGKKRKLKIVGIAMSPEFVYVIGPGSLVPDDKRFGIVWMGQSALEAAFDLKEAFNDVTLTLTRSANEQQVIQRLDALLEPYGGTGAYTREDHVSDTFIRSELDQLRNMTNIMPPIFLAVAAFLLNIVIKRMVDTEREQIGLLKAFGYSNLDVGWHYMKFVLIVGLIGSGLGVAIGTWLGRGMTEMYTEYYRFPVLYYRMSLSIIFGASLVALASAGAGAFQAILKAARLAPAVAMQPQPPTIYRKGAIESWGLLEGLSAPSRMIIRHVIRWPLRAGLTVLGISFAGAILILSYFFIDSVDAMLDSYFFQSQRQDFTLQFATERNSFIKNEIANLPGVLQTELQRNVSVRLKHQHLMERASIIGIDEGSELSGLSDADGHPVSLPPSGLVLSDKMAENLDVEVGQWLEVEVLEGKRPERTIPVSLIVREYIGAMVYMNRQAVHSLMMETSSASAAYLKVDPAQSAALYASLKELPVVISVSRKSAALESFEQIMDETFLLMVSIYVGFASVISIGVVYNSARISLAERARELASLRVMGFHKSEVTYILLGELGLLIFLSLPLGTAIGYGIAYYVSRQFSTDLYRLPMELHMSTIGVSVVVVVISSIVTALIVARRVARLDLVAVLKTRE